MEEPFIIKKKNTIGNVVYDGYCIDVLKAIQAQVATEFNEMFDYDIQEADGWEFDDMSNLKLTTLGLNDYKMVVIIISASPPLNRKVGCLRLALNRARCLRVRQHNPAQKKYQKNCM